MNEAWKSIVISEISLAVYVAPGTGKYEHRDRPYHGLILNDEGAEKDYFFSDGRVMHTGSGELFYLPKGSSYTVKDVVLGGCQAINFDADISDTPFALSFRSREAIARLFKSSLAEWRTQTDTSRLSVVKNLCEIILLALREREREYMPSRQRELILPAIEKMSSDFTDPSLTVGALAAFTGMSETYFRKLFQKELGLSPKDYMIALRITYAKKLLESGQFHAGEVAFLSGYTDPCHFSREFARRIGVPPSEYKRKS